MKFFNKIFKQNNKSKDNVITLNVEELDNWLNLRINVYNNLKKYFDSIDENIQNLKKNLAFLENINFESDTDPLIKNRVESNINAYSKQLNLFISKIEQYKSSNGNDAVKYCNFMDVELNKLNKDSWKNFYILQSFFRKEAGLIARDLKELEENLVYLKRGLNNEEYLSIINIFGCVAALKFNVKLKEKLSNERSSLEIKYNDVNNEILTIKKEIEILNHSEDYKHYDDLESIKRDLESDINKINNNVIAMFSVIERGLRKLHHDNKSKLLENYINNPLTLFDDDNLEILSVLNELKDAIKSRKIDFGEKNEKFLENLDLIDKKGLIAMKDDYYAKINKLKEIRKELINNQFLNKFMDYEHKIIYSNYKLENIKKALEKFDTKINNIRVLDIKNELENNIFELIGEKIALEI
ncbi:hypothetical protein HYX18_03525 [Candidatus Woesearchaeota archaeon]|nr:hypothetical protein [Candidatus Woesearchaeota archaeon]